MSSPTNLFANMQAPARPDADMNKRPREDDAADADPAAETKTKRRKTGPKRKLMAHRMNVNDDNAVVEIQEGRDGVSRVVHAQSPGSKYPKTILTPMFRVIYPDLGPGGDVGKTKTYIPGDGKVTEDRAKYSVTCVAGGLTEELNAEQERFLKTVQAKIRECQRQMWQISPKREGLLKKANTLFATLTEDERKEKAYDMFCKDMRTPIKSDPTSFTADCNAYYKKSGDMVEFCCFDRDNNMVQDVSYKSGAIMRIGLSISCYELNNGSCGIKFRLDPRNNVLIRNGTGSTGPTESELAQWDRAPKFLTKEGRVYQDTMVRSPPLVVRYKLESTEGKTIGGAVVDATSAKYTGTFVSNADSAPFFDHMRDVCNQAIRYMFDDPTVLQSVTESEIEDVRMSQTILPEAERASEAKIKDMAFASFLERAKIPFSERDGAKLMKVTQRTTYARSGDTVTFTIQDGEGNEANADGDSYELGDINPGDKISLVLQAAPWVSPSGDGFGVSLKMIPNYPIHIRERGEEATDDLTGGYDLTAIDAMLDA